MVTIKAFYVLFCSFSIVYGCVAALPSACGGRFYVEDTVVINGPFDQVNCLWEFHTQQDRILAFSVLDGNLEQSQDFLTIRDGLNENSPILTTNNQIIHEIKRKNSSPVVYTTRSEATIRFEKIPPTTFQLKIQKAVDCPFNLGSESQCGRILDDVSCYCASFVQRNHITAKTFCYDCGMFLLSLESFTEESAIQKAWSTGIYFWTSLTDSQNEGTFVWETTGTNLYPGYANWAPHEPSFDNFENCVHINYQGSGWNDHGCDQQFDSICELHP